MSVWVLAFWSFLSKYLQIVWDEKPIPQVVFHMYHTLSLVCIICRHDYLSLMSVMQKIMSRVCKSVPSLDYGHHHVAMNQNQNTNWPTEFWRKLLFPHTTSAMNHSYGSVPAGCLSQKTGIIVGLPIRATYGGEVLTTPSSSTIVFSTTSAMNHSYGWVTAGCLNQITVTRVGLPIRATYGGEDPTTPSPTTLC